jgi:GDSL-like Lipase/Acylhydrolase family
MTMQTKIDCRLCRLLGVASIAIALASAAIQSSFGDQTQTRTTSNDDKSPTKNNGKNPRKAADDNSPLKQIEDIAGQPRVLLIGDSISIGYTLDVRRQLAGRANVHRPPTNCGPTSNGLQNLDKWLEVGGREKRWDVIHFNWGLHDLKYMGPNGENLADPNLSTSNRQIKPEDYEKNLRDLVSRLKKTGAKLIWRNTTPVPEGAKGRVPADVDLYNAIATKVMQEFEIPTHDLYSFAKEHAVKTQKKADVHYTPEGSALLAEHVAQSILKRLSE